MMKLDQWQIELDEHIKVWDRDRQDLWKFVSDLNERVKQIEAAVSELLSR